MDKSSINSLPVQSEDIWILNDTHKFYCNDMLNIEIPDVSLIYTDPPWNATVLQQFYKRAATEISDSFIDFLNKRVLHMKHINPYGLIFIEFGLKTYPIIKSLFKKHGAAFLDEKLCTYSTNKTQMVISCFTFGATYPKINIPENLHEWDICTTVLKMYSTPNEIMFEPFCGMGYQARIGIEKGLILRGVELIPSKFEKILHRIKGEWKCQRKNPPQLLK